MNRTLGFNLTAAALCFIGITACGAQNGSSGSPAGSGGEAPGENDFGQLGNGKTTLNPQPSPGSVRPLSGSQTCGNNNQLTTLRSGELTMAFERTTLKRDNTAVQTGKVRRSGSQSYSLHSQRASGTSPLEIPPNDPAFSCTVPVLNGTVMEATLSFDVAFLSNTWHTKWFDKNKTIKLTMDVDDGGGSTHTEDLLVDLSCLQHS